LHLNVKSNTITTSGQSGNINLVKSKNGLKARWDCFAKNLNQKHEHYENNRLYLLITKTLKPEKPHRKLKKTYLQILKKD